MKKFFYVLSLIGLILLSGCENANKDDDIYPNLITMQDIEEQEVGSTFELIYQVYPEEARSNVIFTSSNEEIAQIAANGVVFAHKEGLVSIRISSKYNDQLFSEIEIKIINKTPRPTLVVRLQDQITINKSTYFEVEVSNLELKVCYQSFNENIAYVDNNGKVNAIDIGIAKFRVYLESDPNIYSDVFLEVVEDMNFTVYKDEIAIGESTQTTAQIIPAHSTKTFIFTSSDENIARVDNDGLVMGVNIGTAVITASIKENPDIKKLVTIKVYEVINYEYVASKVLAVDNPTNTIELLNCPITKYNENTKFIKYIDGVYSEASINDLYIGMENIYIRINQNRNEIDTILIDGKFGLSNIRVAVRNSVADTSNQMLYHDEVSLFLNQNTLVQIFDNSKQAYLQYENSINVKVINGQMQVSQDNQVLFSTDKRIVIRPDNNGSVLFTSIFRGMGIPEYEGTIELSLVNGRILVVNDINIDSYLTKVVPSEMPSSFHEEALKAQAIAARTYAFMDLLSRSKQKYGYCVDDSTNSQVYNNQDTNYETTMAVNDTMGLVMTYNGSLIQAYYYSTSSGLTANVSEIWGTYQPYLVGKNLTLDENNQPVNFNYLSETDMLSFYKMIKVNTPDEGSKYHRWKVTFTLPEVAKMINASLPSQSLSNNLLTYVNNSWVSKALPSDLGEVYNVYVSERAVSGIVMSIVFETSTGKYMLKNQSNIRFLLKPAYAKISKNIVTYYAKNTDTDYLQSYSLNDASLRSAFFAIEKSDSSITLYGGGFGHGCGMSQYGAHGLGLRGNTYNQILKTYYTNITIEDRYYNYQRIADFQNLIENYYLHD